MGFNLGVVASAINPLAVLGTVGEVGSGVLDLVGQREANAANAAAADKQMAFQERMSDTAFQRGVDDMKAAGLNPILAAGSPDSSPTGASYTSQNTLSGLGNSARGVMDKVIAAAQLRQINAQTKVAEADAAVKSSQRALVDNQATGVEISNVEALSKGRSESSFAQQYPVLDAILERLGIVSGAAKDIGATFK